MNLESDLKKLLEDRDEQVLLVNKSNSEKMELSRRCSKLMEAMRPYHSTHLNEQIIEQVALALAPGIVNQVTAEVASRPPGSTVNFKQIGSQVTWRS